MRRRKRKYCASWIMNDFEYSPAPRLAALDNLSRVIFIGSFSKTLSASIILYVYDKTHLLKHLIKLQLIRHCEKSLWQFSGQ
jgi:DNA-binding transcriptional MocR family regulator